MVGGGLFLWWGVRFVVCGNEKGPVSSMWVDGTGLYGVWIGLGYLPVEP